MLKKQNYNFERGSSLLEVILSITLVLLLVPFLYVQIADMNDSVKNMAVANKIVKMRNDIKNYILVNNRYFDDNENHELDNDILQEIAPGANRGFVRKKQDDVVGIEAFIEFNIDNSKYKAADIARYIGDDAAVVQSDNTAYSEYWAVALGGDDVFRPGNLIYYVNYSFNSGDESNYLHKSADGGFNVMKRDLNMNNHELKHVNEVDVQNLEVEKGNIKSIKDTSTDISIYAVDVTFNENVNFCKDLSFFSLSGRSSFNICGDFGSIELGKLSANELTVTQVASVTNKITIESGLKCENELSVSFGTVDLTKNTLMLKTFTAATLKEGENAEIKVSDYDNIISSDFHNENIKIHGVDPLDKLRKPNINDVYNKIGVR